jgi:hypothetical protein
VRVGLVVPALIRLVSIESSTSPMTAIVASAPSSEYRHVKCRKLFTSSWQPAIQRTIARPATAESRRRLYPVCLIARLGARLCVQANVLASRTTECLCRYMKASARPFVLLVRAGVNKISDVRRRSVATTKFTEPNFCSVCHVSSPLHTKPRRRFGNDVA